jgi:hypothetical protein
MMRITLGSTVPLAMLAAACATHGFKKSADHVSPKTRLEDIRRAQVWQATDVESMDLRTGPKASGAFTPGETVNCTHVEKANSGSSPKFDCVIPPEDEVKVKFGRENGEVYAEVAATRLFWALGFPVDRMYPVRVVCAGCAEDGTASKEKGGAPVVFDPASIERKFKGRALETAPESGWSWSDLDLVSESAGGAPRAQRDALKLLAVFVQHSDNKAAQQRLVCIDEKAGDAGASCEHSVMMVNDLGQTFGRSNLFNRDAVSSVNLEGWAKAPVWSAARSNATACIGDLPPSQTGSLEYPRISEAGRRFLSDLLMRLSDAQLRDMFEVSRFAERTDGSRKPATVDEWIDAFNKKRGEVTNRTCPS